MILVTDLLWSTENAGSLEDPSLLLFRRGWFE